MAERWAPIAEFIGFYEVSDMGHVRSCARLLGGSRPRFLPARTMRGTISNHGYHVVSLRKPGELQRKLYVHRLVAAAFVSGAGEEVNHIDGVKTNNAWTNLEWCSHAENMAHAWDSGLIGLQRRAA